MRGVPESRNLALAITRRASRPSCTRNFSAGIGRGRGGSSDRYDDAEEPLFGDAVGDGAPKAGPLNARFLGRGAPINPASGSPGVPIDGFGAPARRGLNNSFQPPATNGPLLSNPSFGRGSMFQNQGEDVFSDAKPPPRPSLDLGSGGFGRGKPVEKPAAPREDIFSSDRRSTLSSWSQWDDKVSKGDTKEAPSPSELRLMQDEHSTGVQFPGVPQQQPGQLGQERLTQAFQSPASASSIHAAPLQQPPSSPGRQPVQQPNLTDNAPPMYTTTPAGRQPIQQPNLTYNAPPMYTTTPAGWQQPVQQPYDDGKVTLHPSFQYARPPPGWQQQPAQQPYYDARFQPHPSFQYRPPSTGYQQPAQQPYGDPRVQPQPSMQYTPPSTDLNSGSQQPVQQPLHDPRIQMQPSFQYSPPPPGWQYPGQQPYYDARFQPHASMQYTPPPPTGWQQPVQRPVYDAMVRPQPSVQYTPHPSGWQQPVQSPYYNGSFQPQQSMQITPPPPDLQPPKSTSPSQAATTQQLPSSGSPPSSPGRQPMQQLDLVDESTLRNTTPSAEASRSGHEAQSGASYKEDDAFSSSTNMVAVPTPPDTGAQSFASFERSKSILGIGIGRGKVLGSSSETSMGRERTVDSFLGTAGMGRGKVVESFFNFDFSGGLGSVNQGRDTVKPSIQMDQESKTGVQDEYSQTFTPVLRPGLYGFAPEGVSIGPGAGRGRPQSPQARSPQARGVGLDSGPLLQFDIGPDRGSSSYEQRMQAALQQRPPRYSLDSQSLRAAEPEYDYPEEDEPVESSVSEEEAAERAMKILQGRVERRVNRLKGFMEHDEDSAVRRRSPLQLAQALRQRRQPQELMKMDKEVNLTEEEQKKEAERLKALEENETLQKLQHTFDQFMKCYGEMALEPEHELGDFTNPDIDEKPFMSLEEYLEKVKPNVMKTGLIRSEKEWQDMVKDTMRHVPYYEEFVERYSGPGRYTAKQENEDLEEIAATLPSDSGRAAKAFVQRSLTTLKSNPAFNLQQKQWLLASMVDEFSQFIVND